MLTFFRSLDDCDVQLGWRTTALMLSSLKMQGQVLRGKGPQYRSSAWA